MVLAYVMIWGLLHLLYYKCLGANTKPVKSRQRGAVWHQFGVATCFGAAVTAGGVSSVSYGGWLGLAVFVANGLMVVAVFLSMQWSLNWAVLWKDENRPQINEGNLAIIGVEVVMYFAQMLIMAAFWMNGESSAWISFWGGVVIALLGVATWTITYRLYSLAWKWIGDCDIDAQIGSRCNAAAIDVGSFILSMAVILAFSMAGDSMGLQQDIVAYLRYVAVGVAALMVIRSFLVLGTWLSHHEVGLRRLRRSREHHGRIGTSLFIGAISVIAALAIGVGIL